MRTRFIALVLGLGVAVAAAGPSLACAFNTQASNDQTQQTARAELDQSSQGTTQTQ